MIKIIKPAMDKIIKKNTLFTILIILYYYRLFNGLEINFSEYLHINLLITVMPEI